MAKTDNQRLNATVKIGGALSHSFRGAITSSRKQIASVGDAIKQLKTREKRLSKVADHWEKQGRDARAYRDEIERVNKQLGKLRRSEERVGRIRNAQQANVARRGQLRGQMFDAVAIGAAAAAPLAAAVHFESTMADLNKVANLTPKRLKAVRQQILGMSREMPVAADQIGAIMTAAAQSGIAQDQITGFTRTAIKMGVAFDIAGGQAGEMMAKWRTGMQLTQPQASALADVTNYLSNNMAATAPQIADVVTRVGAYAKTAGIGEKQTAALAASMIAAGGAPEKVATGIKRMASNLTAGESATKKQAEAMDRLGFTASDMAKRMQDDAAGTIELVLKRIKSLDKAKQPAVIKELFGQESVGVIAPLLSNLDNVQGAFQMAGDKAKYLGSMQKEYAARSKTTENNLQLLKNKTVAVGVTLGTVLLPPLNLAASGIGEVADLVADLAERFPFATKVIVGATVALAGLKIASIAGGYAFTFLKGGALSVVGWLYRTQAAAEAASTSTAAAEAGPTRLGRALMGIGPASRVAIRSLFSIRGALIATGIGALVVGIGVAAGLLIKYWEPIKAFFGGLWTGIKAGIQPLVDQFNGLLDALGPVGDALRAVGGAIGRAVSWFFGLFKPVDESKQALQDWADVGQSTGRFVANVLGAAFGTIKTLFEWSPYGLIVKNWTPITGFFSDWWDGITSRFAKGIQWIADKLKWVGQAYNTVKGWFGGGDDGPSGPDLTAPDFSTDSTAQDPRRTRVGAAQSQRPVYQPGGDGLRDGPPVPLRRNATAGGPHITDQSSTSVTVVQQPGEDGEAVARRAADMVKDDRQREQRTALYDQGPAYGH